MICETFCHCVPTVEVGSSLSHPMGELAFIIGDPIVLDDAIDIGVGKTKHVRKQEGGRQSRGSNEKLISIVVVAKIADDIKAAYGEVAAVEFSHVFPSTVEGLVIDQGDFSRIFLCGVSTNVRTDEKDALACGK